METLRRIGLIVPVMLEILGLSSLVDGVVTWYSFLRDILNAYQLVRDWLAYLFFNWWLKYFDFILPGWIADIWIAWSACFVIVRIVDSNPVEWEARHWGMVSMEGWASIIRVYALSPLILTYGCFMPNQTVVDMLTRIPREQWMPNFVIDAIRQRYQFATLGVVGGFIILLFINWQILQKL
jgi:hypothetical protein